MDNLSSHKVEGGREAIRAVGASILYLPPHSPHLNPIEQVFAKLKALLRREPPHTVNDLIKRIGHLLDRFPPNERANSFHAAGYQHSM